MMIPPLVLQVLLRPGYRQPRNDIANEKGGLLGGTTASFLLWM